MTSPIECYKEYVALKRHFENSSYDYFKYNGKVKVSSDSFQKRKDKYFFEKIARHPDLHNFLLANLSKNPKYWIRELAGTDAENTYKEWVKRQQSLTYMFKQELSKLDSDFNSNFICKNNKHPILLKLYLAKDISLETLCLLLEFSGAMKHWNEKMEYDIVWDETRIKIEKYTPFIKADKKKLKEIVIDSFD